MRSCAAALLLAWSVWAAGEKIDATTIVRRSMERIEFNWRVSPGYDFFERDRDESGETKTFHVRMISGSPYRVLVSVNGQPLPPDQKAEEQRKLEQETVRRRNESPQQRAERIVDYTKKRRRERQVLDQWDRAFQYQLLGEQSLGLNWVYVVKATPRRGYRPPSRDTEVLAGLEAKLYIDAKSHQWVRAEADVVRRVWFEEFMVWVRPGAHFEFNFAPVSEGIWQPSHFEMRSHAMFLLLIPIRIQHDEAYFNYRKTDEGWLGDAELLRRTDERATGLR